MAKIIVTIPPDKTTLKLAEAARLIAEAVHGKAITDKLLNTQNWHFWNFKNEIAGSFINDDQSSTSFHENANISIETFRSYIEAPIRDMALELHKDDLVQNANELPDHKAALLLEPETEVAWDDWLNREQITLDDALWLSMPAPTNPPGTGCPETSLFDDEYQRHREIAQNWIDSGKLQYRVDRDEQDRDYYIKPLDFFRLAKDAKWLSELNREHDPIFILLAKANDISTLSRLTDEELASYLKHQKWTALQAIFVLHGMKPEGTDENSRAVLQTHFIKAYSYLAQDAMTAGEGEPLKPKKIGGGITTCCETPGFWFLWAQSKELPIDSRLAEQFNSNAVAELQAESIDGDNVSKTKSSTKKEVYVALKDLVIDSNKLATLLNKNASRTTWLTECKSGDGYDLTKVIGAHAKRGLLKEEHQKKYTELALGKALS